MKPRPLSTLLITPRGQCSARTTARGIQRRAPGASRTLHYAHCRNTLRTTQSFTTKTYSKSSSILQGPTSQRCIRHASSSTATATKPQETSSASSSSSSSSQQQQPRPFPQPSSTINDKLNPPAETYAPPLSVPERKPDQGYLKYVWTAGRAYFAFYKQGIKNVRGTAKLAKQLRTKAKPRASSHGNGNDELGALTRAEWQVVKRSRKDMLRLPAFGLILLVFGEWTPLLVMVLTPVVPEACRIPSQVQKEIKKLEDRRRERTETLARNMHNMIPRSQAGKHVIAQPKDLKVEDVGSLDAFNLLNVSSRLDAHSWVWEFYMQPSQAWLRRALKRKLGYLRRDDALVERDGGWRELGEEELKRACVERGISVIGRGEQELKKGLEEWFEARKHL